jgi:hypothetical protein
MRGMAVALVGAALLGGLTACSPGRNAVAAIGYDEQGRLVGGVKVCDGDTVESTLTAAKGHEGDLSSWRRGTALGEGVETWELEGKSGSPWRPAGAPLPDLGPKTEYVFGTTSDSGSSTSNRLEFRGRDLLRLAPGELLVEQDPDAVTRTLVIIPWDQLGDEDCVR